MSKTKEKVEQKKHIDIKDKGDDVSKIIGDMIQETIQRLTNLSYDKMLTNLNVDKSKWYNKQNASLSDFKTKLNNVATKEKKRLNKAIMGAQEVLNLTPKQTDIIKNSIITNIPKMVNSVYQTHVKNITEVKTITYKSNVTNDLYNAIKKKIEYTQNYGIVEYKNGRKIKWENYMEMKVRTDIQNDISDNMISAGASNGVIFYLAAYFGDCAIDHADYQGKIYYDANYESIAPKEMLDDIKAYIDSNKLMSIQEIKDGPVYLTTRPNCRHYFQYISIDEVLEIKNNKELNKKREELGLNFNGKYKPSKYKALSQQRANERQIRKWKGKLEADNKIYSKIPKDITMDDRIKIETAIATDKRKIQYWQKQQRELISKNKDTLQRNYDREAYGKMISDFSIKKEIEEEKKGNDDSKIFRKESRNFELENKIINSVGETNIVPEKMVEILKCNKNSKIIFRKATKYRQGSAEHIIADHFQEIDDHYIECINNAISKPINVGEANNGRKKLVSFFGKTKKNTNIYFWVILEEKESEIFEIVSAYPTRRT